MSWTLWPHQNTWAIDGFNICLDSETYSLIEASRISLCLNWKIVTYKSSVPVNLANSLSSIAPFFSFFSRRYSRANSSSSSTVWVARLCLAVFFLVTVAAAFGVLLSLWGFGSCCFASFFACRFFFLCFSRDLSLNYQRYRP